MGAGGSILSKEEQIGPDDLDASIKVVAIMNKLEEIHQKKPLPFWGAYRTWAFSLAEYFEGIKENSPNDILKKYIQKGISAIANPKETLNPGIAGFDEPLYKSLYHYSMFLFSDRTIAAFKKQAGYFKMPNPPKEPEWVGLKRRLDALRASNAKGGARHRRKTRRALRRRLTRRRR